MKKDNMKRAAVLLASVAALTGCAMPSVGTDGEETTAAATTAQQAESSEQQTSASGDEEIVLQVVDWSDSSKAWRDEFHQKFMEEHPGVTIEYTCLTQDQFQNTIMTSIMSDDAPDLFPVPVSTMRLPTCVQEGWFLPLNDLMPEGFFDQFEEGTLVEGNHYIDGVYYTLPEKAAPTSVLMFYNKDILEECGLEVPTTYSEFREACRIVTEQGAGEYYGLIDGGKQVARLESLVRGLANLAGGQLSDNNMALTSGGRAPYDSEAMIGAYTLLSQLYQDGSIHPDTVNLTAPEARSIFAQGEAAFLCQGSWCIATWSQENPDFNYGVMPLIIPDDGQKGYLPVSETIAWMGISSQTEHPELAAEYLVEMYGEDFQGATVAGGERYSVIKGINEKYMTEGPSQDYYNIAQEQTLSTPIATHRDSKVNDFYAEVKSVDPSLGSIAQGVIAGSITEDQIQGILTELADATTAEWQRASEAVGLDFGVFEFPNWDPMEAYTEEDYAELQ